MEDLAPRFGNSFVDAAILARTQEMAPCGVLTTDAELRITGWNAWLETHSGIRAEAAIGRPLLQLFGELISRRLDRQFRRALEGEVSVLSSAFHEYLIPFRSPRPAQVAHMRQTARIAPLMVEGRVCGTIAVIEDVTQRELDSAALRRQSQRDRLLSSALERLLTVEDPAAALKELFEPVGAQLKADLFLVYSSQNAPGALRLHATHGVSPEERSGFEEWVLQDERLLGDSTPLSGVVSPGAALLDGLSLEKLRIHQYLVYPLRAPERLLGAVVFGSRDPIQFAEEELEFGRNIARYASIALGRAESERQLREAHAQLEQRVEERTSQLKDSIAQLESFSYTVAHDLRAPIRAMRGYAEVLLEELGSSLSVAQRQYLAKIRIAATGMELLTRNLLDFSRVSRQQLELVPINLDDLVREIVLLIPTLQVPGILTVQGPLPAVLGQHTLLQRALSNLLDNALKFIAPGTQPRIQLRAELRMATASGSNTSETAPRGSGSAPAFVPSVRLWVEDNGIGIAPEHQGKIFGIFERIDSRDGYEGTGVGLAIVARSMQRMGGSCGVESQVGQGSRFWLELPLAQEAPLSK